jgi:hypothetical protein
MSLVPELLGGSIYSIKTPHFHYRGFLSDECKLMEGKLKIYNYNFKFIAVVKIVNNEIIKVYNYDPETIKYATDIFNKFINIELLTECKKKLNIKKDVDQIPLINTQITKLIKQQKIDKESRAKERDEERVKRRIERIIEEQYLAEQERRAIKEEQRIRDEQEAIYLFNRLIKRTKDITQFVLEKYTSSVEPINIDEIATDEFNAQNIKIFDFIKDIKNINNSIIIKYEKSHFVFNKNDFNKKLILVYPCVLANDYLTEKAELRLSTILITNVIEDLLLHYMYLNGNHIVVSPVLLNNIINNNGNIFIRIDKTLVTYDSIASYNVVHKNESRETGFHCNKDITNIDLCSVNKTTPLMTLEQEKELKEQERIVKEEQERKVKEEKERIAEKQRKAKEEYELRVKEYERIERENYEIRRKEYERIVELRRKEKEDQERIEREEYELQRKEKEEQERIVEQQRKAKEERIANHHHKAQDLIDKRRPFLEEIIKKVSEEKIYLTYTGNWTLNQWIESTHTNEKKAGILIKLKEDIDKDLIETYLISDFISNYSKNYIMEKYKDLSQSDYDIFIRYIENLTKQVVNYYKKLKLKYLKYKNKYIQLKKLQIVEQ